ncbi:ribonuclease III domain-containing protein [Aspergillus pseudoustus]|uniref:Ribonuclease III domain-containing protein n=1 Tax=Aspergillus pseudoustus TaxID=1810923 RepID=A0ABR4IF14_9EURO
MKLPRSSVLRLATCRPAPSLRSWAAVERRAKSSALPTTQNPLTPWISPTSDFTPPKPINSAISVPTENATDSASVSVELSSESLLSDLELIEMRKLGTAKEVDVSSNDLPIQEEPVADDGLASEDFIQEETVDEDPLGEPVLPSHIGPPIGPKITAFMERFDLDLKRPHLLTYALRAKSFTVREATRRFALVGDSVLRTYAATVGYKRAYSPGTTTLLISKLYNNEVLAGHAWKLHIDEYSSLRDCMASARDYNKLHCDTYLATVMEAIVGAVFINKQFNLDATIPIITALGLAIPDKGTVAKR